MIINEWPEQRNLPIFFIYNELTFVHRPPLYVLLASDSSCPVWERKIWALEKARDLLIHMSQQELKRRIHKKIN